MSGSGPVVQTHTAPLGENAIGGRIRLKYSKVGKIRFVGHRDLALTWERAFRRTDIHLAFSEGFTPHPKISFGGGLPVGWESTAEYLDVSLTQPEHAETLAAELNDVLPEGMVVSEARPVGSGAPSIASAVERAAYRVWMSGFDGDRDEAPCGARLGAELAAIKDSRSLVAKRMRKGAEVEDDLRPLIFEIELAEDAQSLKRLMRDNSPVGYERYGREVVMLLATQPRVLRPEELAALVTRRGLACEAALVRREAQYALDSDEMLDPMHPRVLGGSDVAWN